MDTRIKLYEVGLVRDVTGEVYDRPVNAPEHVVCLVQHWIGLSDRERVVVVMLNSRLRCTGCAEVAVGSQDRSYFVPADVLRPALLHGAHSVIVAHNHPSGDTTHSREDRDMARRLKSAGEVVGIPMHDFLIVTRDSHLSFLQEGMI